MSNSWITAAAAAALLAACEKKTEPGSIPPAEAHVITELVFEGATAEDVEAALRAVAPSLRLAVIGEGLATVYFDLPLAEVESEMSKGEDSLPADCHWVRTRSVAGAIPPPPEQKPQDQLRFELDAQALQELGVAAHEVARQLRQLELSPATTPAAEALEGRSILLPDGRTIPLSGLARAELIKVVRPLILEPE